MTRKHTKLALGPFESAFYVPNSHARDAFAVSTKSVWKDDIWRFQHNTAGQPAKRAIVRWDAMRGDADLKDDCKLFIWSLLTENMRGRAHKTTSLSTLGGRLRRFLQWMQHCGVNRFSDLPERFGYMYLEYLLESIGTGTVNDETIGGILDLPVRIYEQSPIMAAAGRDGLRFHPYGGQNAYALARNYGVESGHIPPVPDKLFIATSAEIFRWVDQYSKDIIRAAQIATDARENGPQYEKWRAYGVNKALKAFRFFSGGEVWHPPFGDNPTTELRELLSDLRIACVIAIQSFVGIRINELLSLEAEPRDPNTGLPACLTVRPSRNGLLDIFYVKGRLAKARDEYDDVEWVAGARPAGSKQLPPPVKAILVLEEAFRGWRDKKTTRLVLNQHQGGRGLPDTKPMRPASYKLVAYEQMSFVRRHIYETDPELAESILWWRVSTHQWRKSFAQYVVRSDESLLRAVSEHFKHVSMAMTSEDYIGNDLELLGFLDDEGLQRAAEIMVDLVTGSTYGSGPLADLIQKRSSSILGLAGVGTRETKIEAVKDVLAGDNIRSWACGWGDCLFRPETARCHLERTRKLDLTVTRPNTVTRRPSLCCDCQNLIVLREHEPYWKQRKSDNLALLKGESDKTSAIARTAKSRVEQCERILNRLNQSKKKANGKKAK